jgi:hypothetical protein
MGILDDKDRYSPRTIDELAEDPIPSTLLTEPVGPANVRTLVPKARSLHAVLVESLNSTQWVIPSAYQITLAAAEQEY